MPDPKTIKLLVTIPDPGEWCYNFESISPGCQLWNSEWQHCYAKHSPTIEDDEHGGRCYRRPQSCKASEVKP